jgi:hypothetical protein
MARGKSFKQVYFGRVIAPAKYHAGNGKPFISFTLLVDNLAIGPDKQRTSGRVQCSYSIVADNDPVPTILCRILNAEAPGVGGLAGVEYKSVEVLAQGDEKLTQVLDANGEPIPNAYYKNLEYCTIQVTDNNILDLYRSHVASAEDNPQMEAVQKPTRAPGRFQAKTSGFIKSKAQDPSASVRPASPVRKPVRPKYEVGDRLSHNGVLYEFQGGDPNNLDNWMEVAPEVEGQELPTNPFMSQGSPRTSPLAARLNGSSSKGLLDDEDEDELAI